MNKNKVPNLVSEDAGAENAVGALVSTDKMSFLSLCSAFINYYKGES